MTDDTGNRPDASDFLDRDALQRQTFENAQQHFLTWEDREPGKRRLDLEKWAFVALAIGRYPANPPAWALEECARLFSDEHHGDDSVIFSQRRTPRATVEVQVGDEVESHTPDYRELLEELAYEIVSQDIEQYWDLFYLEEEEPPGYDVPSDEIDGYHDIWEIIEETPRIQNEQTIEEDAESSTGGETDRARSGPNLVSNAVPSAEVEQWRSRRWLPAGSSLSLNALCKQTVSRFYEIEMPHEDHAVKRELYRRWREQSDEQVLSRLMIGVRMHQDRHGPGRRFSLDVINRWLAEQRARSQQD